MSAVAVAGTRPEVVKLWPVLKRLDELGLEYFFVWSGQHYDYEMSRVFFEELGVRSPDVDLSVGSGSHAEQTGRIMLGVEKVLGERRPAVTVAQGDTNSVLAAALASVKVRVPFAHVEAGLRSWSMVMPEEVNRRVADAVASLHFAPTRLSALNLIFEGVSPRGIHVTGNTVVDVIYEQGSRVDALAERLLGDLGLEKAGYVLATLHRAENVDDPARLGSILKALAVLSGSYPVVFPAHPRTLRRVSEFGLWSLLDKVRVLKPLGYLEFLSLLKNARVVVTDSGGVQEEAFTLKVPTVTVRYNTERPETTMYGINVLSGAEWERVVGEALKQAERYERIKKLDFENPLGDGRAGERIANILREFVESGEGFEEADLRRTPFVLYRLTEGVVLTGEVLACFDEKGVPRVPPRGQECWRTLLRFPVSAEDLPDI